MGQSNNLHVDFDVYMIPATFVPKGWWQAVAFVPIT